MNSGNDKFADLSARSPAMHPAVRDARLVERLDTLRSGLASVEAPAHIERTLVREFHARRVRARPPLWWMPPLAIAATIAVVSWMVRTTGALTAPQPDAAIASVADDRGPFLALKPLRRIAMEPQATIVTGEFPRSLFAQMGLAVSPERAGEPVRAEMLYSAGGEALAVRLLN